MSGFTGVSEAQLNSAQKKCPMTNVQFAAWVAKIKNKNLQERLFVISEAGFHTFKKNKVGSSLSEGRSGSYLSIKRIQRVGPTRLKIIMDEDWIFEFNASGIEVDDIIRIVYENYARAAYGRPATELFEVEGAEIEAPYTAEDEMPALGGLILAYRAHCVKYGELPHPGILSMLEAAADANATAVRVSPSSVDGLNKAPMQALLHAFQYNTWVKALGLVGVKVSKLSSFLGPVLTYNYWLTSLSLIDTKVEWQAFFTSLSFGDRLLDSLTDLEISNCVGLKEKVLLLDGPSIVFSRIAFRKLDLSRNGMSPKSVALIFGYLRSNVDVGTTLRALNISHNKCGDVGTTELCAFVADNPGNSLQVLIAADANLNNPHDVLGSLTPNSPSLSIVDVSGSSYSKKCGQTVREALENSAVTDLDLSSAKLPNAVLSDVLHGFLTDRGSGPLRLILNDVSIGKGAKDMAGALMEHMGSNLHTLYINRCDLKAQHAQSLLAGLKNHPGLRALSLSGNMKADKHLSSALSQLREILETTEMESLILVGAKGKRAGSELMSIVPALVGARSLHTLDVSGNEAGAEFVTALADVIREGASLRSLAFDGNNSSPESINAIGAAAAESTTIVDLATPVDDIRAMRKLDDGENVYIAAKVTVKEWKEVLERNKANLPAGSEAYNTDIFAIDELDNDFMSQSFDAESGATPAAAYGGGDSGNLRARVDSVAFLNGQDSGYGDSYASGYGSTDPYANAASDVYASEDPYAQGDTYTSGYEDDEVYEEPGASDAEAYDPYADYAGYGDDPSENEEYEDDDDSEPLPAPPPALPSPPPALNQQRASGPPVLPPAPHATEDTRIDEGERDSTHLTLPPPPPAGGGGPPRIKPSAAVEKSPTRTPEQRTSTASGGGGGGLDMNEFAAALASAQRKRASTVNDAPSNRSSNYGSNYGSNSGSTHESPVASASASAVSSVPSTPAAGSESDDDMPAAPASGIYVQEDSEFGSMSSDDDGYGGELDESGAGFVPPQITPISDRERAQNSRLEAERMSTVSSPRAGNLPEIPQRANPFAGGGGGGAGRGRGWARQRPKSASSAAATGRPGGYGESPKAPERSNPFAGRAQRQTTLPPSLIRSRAEGGGGGGGGGGQRPLPPQRQQTLPPNYRATIGPGGLSQYGSDGGSGGGGGGGGVVAPQRRERNGIRISQEFRNLPPPPNQSGSGRVQSYAPGAALGGGGGSGGGRNSGGVVPPWERRARGRGRGAVPRAGQQQAPPPSPLGGGGGSPRRIGDVQQQQQQQGMRRSQSASFSAAGAGGGGASWNRASYNNSEESDDMGGGGGGGASWNRPMGNESDSGADGSGQQAYQMSPSGSLPSPQAGSASASPYSTASPTGARVWRRPPGAGSNAGSRPGSRPNSRPNSAAFTPLGLDPEPAFPAELPQQEVGDSSHPLACNPIDFGGDTYMVPPVVRAAVEWLEMKGTKEEGIFRIPSSKTATQILLNRFMNGEPVNLFEEVYDPLLVGGLLKMYFREYNDSQFPPGLRGVLMEALQVENVATRALIYRNILSVVSPGRRAMMRRVCYVLTQIVANKATTKMGVQNVGKCIGPTMFPCMNVGAATSTICVMISHFSTVFPE